MLNSVSSIHSAAAKVSLTPAWPRPDTEFISSTRKLRWRP
jgi:hypothetical protein